MSGCFKWVAIGIVAVIVIVALANGIGRVTDTDEEERETDISLTVVPAPTRYVPSLTAEEIEHAAYSCGRLASVGQVEKNILSAGRPVVWADSNGAPASPEQQQLLNSHAYAEARALADDYLRRMKPQMDEWAYWCGQLREICLYLGPEIRVKNREVFIICNALESE